MQPTVPEREKKPTIEVLCCYAREDQSYLLKLKIHLALLQRERSITLWADIDIDPGEEWETELHRHLDSAHIILLLVSAYFMASDYCYSTEMEQAMKRHKQDEARVIPLLLRPTDWQGAPFGKLQALPTGAVPVDDREWHSQDEAFEDIARGIRKVVEDLQITLQRKALKKEKISELINKIEEGIDTYTIAAKEWEDKESKISEQEQERQELETKKQELEVEIPRINTALKRQATSIKELRITQDVAQKNLLQVWEQLQATNRQLVDLGTDPIGLPDPPVPPQGFPGRLGHLWSAIILGLLVLVIMGILILVLIHYHILPCILPNCPPTPTPTQAIPKEPPPWLGGTPTH